jgi:uncharacterized membrane protein YdfJ with MMPL/SSD domain
VAGAGPIRSGAAERAFARLGRGILRHPWYPILFWVLLLLVAAPFLSRVGSVTTNSASDLPASAPSSIANAKIAQEFPNASAATDSILLLVGPNITGPVGEASVLGLAQAISTDPNVTHLAGVSTLYSSYAGYLAGQGELALGVLRAAEVGPPNAFAATNQTAELLWGPPALFVQNWEAYGASHPNATPTGWNAPAYATTRSELGGSSLSLAVLDAFYAGTDPAGTGAFNGTAQCALLPAQVVPCAEGAARTTLLPILDGLLPSPAAVSAGTAVLGTLGLGNFSNPAAQTNTTILLIAPAAGLPVGFLRTMALSYPSFAASPIALGAWANATADGDPAQYPFPVPSGILDHFVAPGNDAEILFVTYTVGSSYVDSHGGTPVPDDVARIGTIVPSVLARTDPGRSLTYYQTGGAALDADENSVLNASLAVVLPLTIIVLVLITMAYFRAPLTPLITVGGLGIALGLGVGAVVLIGTLVTHVDVTSIELTETFVLGVGTDYSIFLVSRYREELYRGQLPPEALVTSVTWAGQSVATSGATAILATVALAFSGVALLSQWGMVLSLAILVTVLLCLTIVPAFLALLGPRVFWPYTGRRGEAQAERVRARAAQEDTYFFRAARRTQRRPRTTIALILLVSIPLVFLAITAPISYDFYQQLPRGSSATDGLAVLGDHFGAGYSFPIETLVTFQGPLLVGNATNATEFRALSDLTNTFRGTAGVHSVGSPVGPDGASLATWLNLSTLPLAPQENLRGLLASYVGADGRSVLLTITANSSGLSYSAVQLLDTLRGEYATFAASHPSATGAYFGGGAPTTSDLAAQTALATERMILFVAIGLILVLFVVLRSWIIPLLGVATIGLSLAWAWGITDAVLRQLAGIPLFFYVPTILFIIILGLGIDYNIFLLTRVREERIKGRAASDAVVRAVATTGGIITAAAVILASAFAVLATGEFLLLRAIGFAVATAIVLDAMVVRTYLVPAALQSLGDRVWKLYPFQRRPPAPP